MEKFKSKMFRIYIAPFWKYRCDMFYFRKHRYIKGFAMRFFYIDIRISEKNALEKLISIGRKIQKQKTNAGMV